ncbi:TonB-dependent receptor [Acidipila sp. EB88]|uniref:TonB-dependent receptor n=1 Tax=Acidipila sp. EB88 TaxID=2305226 RepID=UPI00131551FC|nr:carboxypeptidase regulatory-like domain-containing protein [Acidipila sp. EB88]
MLGAVLCPGGFCPGAGPGLLEAQTADRGAIRGAVRDLLGRPVRGAALSALDPATGHTLTAISDERGLFSFQALAPGTYQLTAVADTFATWQTDAVVTVGTVTTLEATLPIGSSESVVRVEEVAPVIDTATVAVSTTLDAGAIEDLPSSTRRWTDFALLTPAVTPDASADGLLSFRGIGALLNNATVDGADNNQAFFSEERGRTTIAYAVSQAAIEQFQVNASNYGAQYGRAAGGVINTVTRSGGNSLHGELFFYDRNSAWGATNAFASSTAVTVGESNSVATSTVRMQNTLTQAGGSVGGPLVHGKVFGFATYDRYHHEFPGIARASNATKLFATPTQQSVLTLAGRLGVLPAQAQAEYNGVLTGLAGLLGDVPRSADESFYFPKLDWQVSDRTHATLQWSHLNWNSPNGVQTSPTATYGSNSFGNSATTNDTLIGRVAYFLSPNVLNEFTFQYGRDFESQLSNAPAPFEQSIASNIYGKPPQVEIEDYGFRFGNPPVLNRAAYPDERRYEAADSVTWVHGRHTLKIGYSADYVNDYSDALYNANGTYVYANVMDFATDYLSPDHCDNATTGTGVLPCYAYYTQGFGPTSFQFQSDDYAGFVSDEWKARPGLTLSLGLRYEYEQLPDTNAALRNPDIPGSARLPHDKNNYGPRVGAAWDIGGEGHTVLRAGFGVYYGRIINSTAFSALTETGTANAQRSYYFTPLSTGTPPFPFVFSSTPYLSVAPAAVYFDPRFQNPQIEQAELSLEQKIGRSTSITASGLFSAGRELPSYVDSNIDLSSAQFITYTVVDALHQGPLPATYTTRFYTARLNPNYQQITRIFSETNSKYMAGVVRADHGLSRALDLHASFTYAHTVDWNQNATAFTDTDDVLDPANLALEYGDSNFDIRRRFTGGMVLKTPRKIQGRLGLFMNGLEMAPTAEVRDGLPYSMQTSGSIPAMRYTDEVNRKEVLSGLGASINGSGGAARIAEVGRNTFRYPAVINANLRISKRTQLTPRVSLEILGESFNLLNHQNLTSIDTTGYSISNSSVVGTPSKLTWQSGTVAGSSEFGTPLNGNNTNLYQDRQIQLSTRLHF